MEQFLVLILLSVFHIKVGIAQDDPCDTFTCNANEICVARTSLEAFCECPTSSTSPPCPSASDSKCPAPVDTGICTEVAYDRECNQDFPCPEGKICCLSFCGTDCIDPPSSGNSLFGSGFLRAYLISMLLSGRQGKGCPRGTPSHCHYDACQRYRCATHYNARCETTCGGCIAHFFDRWGHDITSECSCPYQPVSCPNLCAGKTCRGYPDSECRIRSCGRCSYGFVDHYGYKLTCRQPIQLPAPIPARPLPPSQPQPSYDRRCQRLAPAYATTTCAPRVCNSNNDCRSDYMCCPLVRCGTVCTAKPAPCEAGQNLIACPDLCQSLTCKGNPAARCRVNNCNACIPEFFDTSNRLLRNCLSQG